MATWIVPELPQAFWGNIWLDGEVAPVGTQVTGQAENVRLPAPNNPLVITEAGKLGGDGGFSPKLVAQGDFRRKGGAGPIPRGSPVSFFVEGNPDPLWVYDPNEGIWAKSVPFKSGGVSEIWLAG